MPETMNALCLIRFWNLGPISVFCFHILNKSVLGRRKKCGDSPLTYKIILIWQPPRPRLREHNSNYSFYIICFEKEYLSIDEQERAFNRLVPVGVSQNIECRTDDAKTGLGIRSLVFRANHSFFESERAYSQPCVQVFAINGMGHGVKYPILRPFTQKIVVLCLRLIAVRWFIEEYIGHIFIQYTVQYRAHSASWAALRRFTFKICTVQEAINIVMTVTQEIIHFYKSVNPIWALILTTLLCLFASPLVCFFFVSCKLSNTCWYAVDIRFGAAPAAGYPAQVQHKHAG